MRAALVLAVAACVSGCGAMPKSLQGAGLTNHVTVTADLELCMTLSRWGVFGISGDLRESECRAITEGLLLRLLWQMQQRKAGGT